MNGRTASACAAILLLAALAAVSQSNENGAKLIQASDCSSCHAADRQIVGPAYSDVAQRYAGQAEAVDKLSAKIRDGGSGMTAHPALTDAQRREMVQWILAQKPASAPQTQAKSYALTLKDGTTVTLDFPLYAEGKAPKVTKDVFHGYQFYNSYCYRCHGTDATGGQLAPDLRRSLAAMKQQEFLSVAMTGKAEKGMPAWAGFLTEDDVIHIYRYVRGRSLDLISPGRPPSEQD